MSKALGFLTFETEAEHAEYQAWLDSVKTELKRELRVELTASLRKELLGETNKRMHVWKDDVQRYILFKLDELQSKQDEVTTRELRRSINAYTVPPVKFNASISELVAKNRVKITERGRKLLIHEVPEVSGD